jgi:hypothetical protein
MVRRRYLNFPCNAMNGFHLLENCFIYIKKRENRRKKEKIRDNDIVENWVDRSDTLKIPTKIIG